MNTKRRHGGFRAAAILVAIAAAFTMPSRIARAGDIRVREVAEVRTETVALGDIATILNFDDEFTAKLKAVVLADTPRLGADARIRARDIRGILKNSGANLANIHIYGSAACTVTRFRDAPDPAEAKPIVQHKLAKPLRRHADSHPEPQSGTIEAALRDYVAARFARDDGKLEVNFNRTSRTVRDLLDEQASAMPFRILERDAITLGLCALEVETTGADGATDSTSVVANIELIKPVIVARKPINRGSTIDKRDLKIEERRFSRFEDIGFSDLELASGHEATRFIRPGEMLTGRFLREKPLVERGEMVKILIRGEGVQITTTGKAQEGGALGDVIAVARNGSRRKSDLIDAVISGPGVVTYGGVRQVARR